MSMMSAHYVKDIRKLIDKCCTKAFIKGEHVQSLFNNVCSLLQISGKVDDKSKNDFRQVDLTDTGFAACETGVEKVLWLRTTIESALKKYLTDTEMVIIEEEEEKEVIFVPKLKPMKPSPPTTSKRSQKKNTSIQSKKQPSSSKYTPATPKRSSSSSSYQIPPKKSRSIIDVVTLDDSDANDTNAADISQMEQDVLLQPEPTANETLQVLVDGDYSATHFGETCKDMNDISQVPTEQDTLIHPEPTANEVFVQNGDSSATHADETGKVTKADDVNNNQPESSTTPETRPSSSEVESIPSSTSESLQGTTTSSFVATSNEALPSQCLTIAETSADLFANGYKRRQVSGEGNCFYMAVCHGMYGNEHHHAAIRTKAMEYMESNLSHFEPAVTTISKRSIAEHIAIHKNLGDYVEEYDIAATATAFQRRIIVYEQQQNAKVFDPIEANEALGRNHPPIMVFYNGHNHYDAIIPLQQHENVNMFTRDGLLKPALNPLNFLKSVRKDVQTPQKVPQRPRRKETPPPVSSDSSDSESSNSSCYEQTATKKKSTKLSRTSKSIEAEYITPKRPSRPIKNASKSSTTSKTPRRKSVRNVMRKPSKPTPKKDNKTDKPTDNDESYSFILPGDEFNDGIKSDIEFNEELLNEQSQRQIKSAYEDLFDNEIAKAANVVDSDNDGLKLLKILIYLNSSLNAKPAYVYILVNGEEIEYGGYTTDLITRKKIHGDQEPQRKNYKMIPVLQNVPIGAAADFEPMLLHYLLKYRKCILENVVGPLGVSTYFKLALFDDTHPSHKMLIRGIELIVNEAISHPSKLRQPQPIIDIQFPVHETLQSKLNFIHKVNDYTKRGFVYLLTENNKILRVGRTFTPWLRIKQHRNATKNKNIQMHILMDNLSFAGTCDAEMIFIHCLQKQLKTDMQELNIEQDNEALIQDDNFEFDNLAAGVPTSTYFESILQNGTKSPEYNILMNEVKDLILLCISKKTTVSILDHKKHFIIPCLSCSSLSKHYRWPAKKCVGPICINCYYKECMRIHKCAIPSCQAEFRNVKYIKSKNKEISGLICERCYIKEHSRDHICANPSCRAEYTTNNWYNSKNNEVLGKICRKCYEKEHSRDHICATPSCRADYSTGHWYKSINNEISGPICKNCQAKEHSRDHICATPSCGADYTDGHWYKSKNKEISGLICRKCHKKEHSTDYTCATPSCRSKHTTGNWYNSKNSEIQGKVCKKCWHIQNAQKHSCANPNCNSKSNQFVYSEKFGKKICRKCYNKEQEFLHVCSNNCGRGAPTGWRRDGKDGYMCRPCHGRLQYHGLL